MGAEKMAEEDPKITEIKEQLQKFCQDAIGDKEFKDIESAEVGNTILNQSMDLLQKEEYLAKHKLFVNVVVFNVNGYAETRSTLWTKDDKDLSILWTGAGKVGVLLKALANPM